MTWTISILYFGSDFSVIEVARFHGFLYSCFEILSD
jgi:hypothetical protein